MKGSIKQKLEGIAERREEIDALLASPEVINDQDLYRVLSQERAEIDPVVECFTSYLQLLDNLLQAEALHTDGDDEMQAFAAEEIIDSKAKIATCEAELERLLIPKDPADNANIYLEI